MYKKRNGMDQMPITIYNLPKMGMFDSDNLYFENVLFFHFSYVRHQMSLNG